jgi:hypothetical protein
MQVTSCWPFIVRDRPFYPQLGAYCGGLYGNAAALTDGRRKAVAFSGVLWRISEKPPEGRSSSEHALIRLIRMSVRLSTHFEPFAALRLKSESQMAISAKFLLPAEILNARPFQTPRAMTDLPTNNSAKVARPVSGCSQTKTPVDGGNLDKPRSDLVRARKACHLRNIPSSCSNIQGAKRRYVTC